MTWEGWHVPSAALDNAPRVVVDESSFDFGDLDDSQVEDGLDRFNDALAELRGTAALSERFWEVNCRDDCHLVTLLCDPAASDVDRDTKLRSLQLLDMCDDWHDWAPDACTAVQLNGQELSNPFSVGFALTMTVRRRGVACLRFSSTPSRAVFARVTGEVGDGDVFFFSDCGELPRFWRHLFTFENVTEKHFHDYGVVAFPELVLHPLLTFGKFDGAYRDLREPVVHTLGALNDHFPHVYEKHAGHGGNVSAVLGACGLTASMESPKTHGSRTAMKQREVEYDGRTYRCEWHAKIEPHRNRIHFTPPDRGPNGRMLVGVFVDHLDT